MISTCKLEHVLTKETLNALFNENILAIHIKGFMGQTACKHIADNLLKEDQPLLQKYAMAQEINLRRIGMSLFETERNEQRLKKYFEETKITQQLLSDICMPFENPIFKALKYVNFFWDCKIEIQKKGKQELNFGLCRVLGENQEFSPHQDFLVRDVDWPELVNGYKNQLSMNIYIQPSIQGGELEIWDYSPKPEELDKYGNGTYDFYHRDLIPVQPLRIQVDAGDLVLFRSTSVHGVREGKGDRISFSNFLAYYGADQPLKYWI